MTILKLRAAKPRSPRGNFGRWVCQWLTFKPKDSVAMNDKSE